MSMRDKLRSAVRKAVPLKRAASGQNSSGATGRAMPHRFLLDDIGPRRQRWLRENRALIHDVLLEQGAVLFQRAGVDSPSAFARFVRECLGFVPMRYVYRSSPRTALGEHIYSSTEYHSALHIPLHNENSYALSWPRYIAFGCVQVALRGGETPIADSRSIYERINPDVRRRFESLGVLYVRNYGSIDLPWTEVFQTANRDEVSAFCERHQLDYRWLGPDRLQTRQVCPAVVQHPQTGEPVWFNQAHLFHVSALEPDVRGALLAACDAEELPRNAYYGDGSPIDAQTIAHINEIYRQAEVVFPWQAGDVLLLDNLLCAHGRRPYTGARRVVVAMSREIGRLAHDG